MFHSYLIVSRDKETQEKYIDSFIKGHLIHPVDVHRLDGTSITIADVRHLIITLSLTPFASASKIAVINGDVVTHEAQQALLKTLEEPPLHTFLLISISHIDLLLPTIVSRTTVTMLSSEKPARQGINFSQIETFWKTVFTSSIGIRMKLTADLTKNRAELVQWLEEQIAWARQGLLDSYRDSRTLTPIGRPLYRQLLHNLSKTRVWILGNISLKLAIDHLLITLPYINAL